MADLEGATLDPIRREACDWVARCLGKGLTSDDIEALKHWYNLSPEHAAAYAEIRRLWQTLGPVAETARQGSRRERSERAARPVFGRRLFLGSGGLAAAAASAAYLMVRPPLSLWPSYADLTADYRTGAAEHRQLTFGGATSVDLNSKTSVAIRSETASAREIELLSGEVAISVRAASKVLTVLAGPVRAVASTADFNLRCDGDRGTISCLKGLLRVEGAGTVVSLSSGQGAAFGAHRLETISTIDPTVVTAWQRGLLIFDAEPVAHIVEEINRYRSGHIILMNQELGRRRMTARLQITETDTIVLELERIFGAKATKLPGGITVLS